MIQREIITEMIQTLLPIQKSVVDTHTQRVMKSHSRCLHRTGAHVGIAWGQTRTEPPSWSSEGTPPSQSVIQQTPFKKKTIEGLFTKSNLAQVEYSTKHAHYINVKHKHNPKASPFGIALANGKKS